MEERRLNCQAVVSRIAMTRREAMTHGWQQVLGSRRPWLDGMPCSCSKMSHIYAVRRVPIFVKGCDKVELSLTPRDLKGVATTQVAVSHQVYEAFKQTLAGSCYTMTE